jgi:hypothetical protein
MVGRLPAKQRVIQGISRLQRRTRSCDRRHGGTCSDCDAQGHRLVIDRDARKRGEFEQ